MNKAVLSLGSNLGNSEAILYDALNDIHARGDTSVMAVSRLFVTAPWGYTDQPDFYNLCAEIETLLSPESLLDTLHSIEKTAGRQRLIHWGPRTLDIDIIAYEGVAVNTPSLTLPHPLYRERAFVLVPLADLYPDLQLFGEEFASALGSVRQQKITPVGERRIYE